MKSDAPRIVIVGCGAICESFYLPALKRHHDVAQELALVDTDNQRLKALQESFGLGNYAKDYHEYLGKVDGAIVATPPSAHHKIAIDFLRRGAHVLCEKPLAVYSSDAREMVEEASRSNVTLSVNNNRRLYGAFKAVKGLISGGSLGKMRSITYIDGEDFRGWPTVSGFYFDKQSSKGALLDQGAHALDAMCWWIGAKPKLTSAQTDSFGGPEAVASVKFEHVSLTGEVRLSWLARLQNRYRIEFEKGYISGGTKPWDSFVVAVNSGVPKETRKESDLDLGQKLVDNFLNVIRGRENPLIPAGEVIESIELIEEAYAAATRFDMPWCTDVEN